MNRQRTPMMIRMCFRTFVSSSPHSLITHLYYSSQFHSIDEYIKGTKKTKSVALLLREIIVLIMRNDERKRNYMGQ